MAVLCGVSTVSHLDPAPAPALQHRRTWRLAILLLTLCTALLSHRPAWADEPTAEVKAQAGKAFERGMKYY